MNDEYEISYEAWERVQAPVTEGTILTTYVEDKKYDYLQEPETIFFLQLRKALEFFQDISEPDKNYIKDTLNILENPNINITFLQYKNPELFILGFLLYNNQAIDNKKRENYNLIIEDVVKYAIWWENFIE